MTTDKHTPGPWHMGAGNGEGSIFSDVEGARMRLETGGTTLYPICAVNRGWDREEDLANARLIAAAPELYEALVRLVQYAAELEGGNGKDFGIVQAGVEALKKTREGRGLPHES